MDSNKECWIHITAGKGPDECALAVAKLSHFIIEEATQQGIKVSVIEAIPGNRPRTYNSILLKVQGNMLENFVKRWKGAIQWICESPFRSHHKRKNWFVSVDVLESISMERICVNEQDIVFESMRASGPGGQHVNTTDSAVRLIHKPTGITIVAREERSQHMNKKIALGRLASKLEDIKQEAISSNNREKWEKHTMIERGNAVKIFVGSEFIERKKP
jgi:peptide chain release factor